jgi:hypothetical protein
MVALLLWSSIWISSSLSNRWSHHWHIFSILWSNHNSAIIWSWLTTKSWISVECFVHFITIFSEWSPA